MKVHKGHTKVRDAIFQQKASPIDIFKKNVVYLCVHIV
jgi:hypothetical protein